jgi:predicted nuclease of predicted toxin-antitoxin system
MKLLFDQNLSYKLCRCLSGGDFADSTQVRLIGLDKAEDQIIWNYAKSNGFTIVTLDADYAELSAL